MNVGSIFTVAASWIGHDARCRGLFELLTSRLNNLSRDEEAQAWLTELLARHGPLMALKPLKVLNGLPGFQTIGFFGRLLDKGTPAELVVTTQSLLFCTPTFAPSCTITELPQAQLRSASTDWHDGSTLVIKTNTSTVKCETAGKLDAKPIAQVITQQLISSRNETS